MKNDAFSILWYVIFSYLYMDLMEFEINTIQYTIYDITLQKTEMSVCTLDSSVPF
jgi:hypothetical protein